MNTTAVGESQSLGAGILSQLSRRIWAKDLRAQRSIGSTPTAGIGKLIAAGPMPKPSATTGERMARTFRAVYKDQQGHTYSCPVEVRDGVWAMLTSDGPQPIGYTFQDDVGGLLTFLEYREEPEPEDLRLHIEPRQPGQSSFRQLPEARAAHINQERKAREEARARAQEISVNPTKVEAARQINNGYAALRNRHGRNQ